MPFSSVYFSPLVHHRVVVLSSAIGLLLAFPAR